MKKITSSSYIIIELMLLCAIAANMIFGYIFGNIFFPPKPRVEYVTKEFTPPAYHWEKVCVAKNTSKCDPDWLRSRHVCILGSIAMSADDLPCAKYEQQLTPIQ